MNILCIFLRKTIPIYFLMSLFFYNHIYADKAQIYCANKDKDWYWLKDDFGNIITAKGTWGYIEEKTFKFKYFLPDDITIFFDFYIECTKLYGDSYLIAQPSFNNTRGWHPFAISPNIFLNGIVQCDIKNQLISLSNTYFNELYIRKFLNLKFPYDDQKYIFITRNNIINGCGS